MALANHALGLVAVGMTVLLCVVHLRMADELKTVLGLLPICSFCKKVRDDRGYWNQLETYIEHRSDARFSHGICPQCAVTHYPEVFKATESVEDKPSSVR